MSLVLSIMITKAFGWNSWDDFHGIQEKRERERKDEKSRKKDNIKMCDGRMEMISRKMEDRKCWMWVGDD